LPESLRTGSSKAATVRRLMPKMSKNSFQNVWCPDFSNVVPFQSREKAMARWRISFQVSIAIPSGWPLIAQGDSRCQPESGKVVGRRN
jgi:hypothetical protein